MKLLYRRWARLDIHKETISACIRIRVPAQKEPQLERAVFGTFTQDLERMRDWLKAHKVEQIAMESTGGSWLPVWNVLEPERWRFELLLANLHSVPDLPQRRGRPCKCVERGMECAHPYAPRPKPAPQPQAPAVPAEPSTCRMCSQWRIPCIHARNAKLNGAFGNSAPKQ